MMKIIGITGGVGSGKSYVLAYIEKQWNAVVCQADHVAWDLQKPGQIGYQEIVRQFGRDILNPDETINRAKLGEIVFRDSDKLSILNEIMHPAVKERIRTQLRIEQEKGTSCFVLEAALLIDDGYDEICDEIWYIYADEAVRRQRLKEDRSYSDDKINAIMDTQLSESSFRKKCKMVIDNSGDFEDTCYQIDEEMKRLGLSL